MRSLGSETVAFAQRASAPVLQESAPCAKLSPSSPLTCPKVSKSPSRAFGLLIRFKSGISPPLLVFAGSKAQRSFLALICAGVVWRKNTGSLRGRDPECSSFDGRLQHVVHSGGVKIVQDPVRRVVQCDMHFREVLREGPARLR